MMSKMNQIKINTERMLELTTDDILKKVKPDRKILLSELKKRYMK